MKKLFILVSVLLTGIGFYSCSSLKPAQGLEDEIYVVADFTEYQLLKPVMDSTFEKIIYTPQPEKISLINTKTKKILFLLLRLALNPKPPNSLIL